MLVHPLLAVLRREEQQFPEAGIEAIAGEIDPAQRPLLEPVAAIHDKDMG
jgi:hypothetical protein